jgi:hypothetical protein
VSVFGLDTYAELPEGWTPLEAVVVVKCLDEGGEVKMFHTATESINSWEALGMARDLELQLEDGLRGKDDPDE